MIIEVNIESIIRDSSDWDKELREYAGIHYSSLTEREKDQIIEDMIREALMNTHFNS